MLENKSFQESSFRSYLASNVLSRQTTKVIKLPPYFPKNASSFRIYIYGVTESNFFSGTILFVTLVNTACLLIQTDESIALRGGKLFLRYISFRLKCNASIVM